MDGRKRPRMDPPLVRGTRTVAVILSADDYRTLYDLTLLSGTSMAETMRRLIRSAAARMVEDHA